MKLKHTTKRSARRPMLRSATGFANEVERKQVNVYRNSPEKKDRRFTKPKKRNRSKRSK